MHVCVCQLNGSRSARNGRCRKCGGSRHLPTLLKAAAERPVALSEERVREIVRDELRRAQDG